MSQGTRVEQGGSQIDKQTLEKLQQKLIETFDTHGRFASFVEWATFAHFVLNTDVAVGRALANHLVETIDVLQPAMPEAETADLVLALSSLAQFLNLGLTRGFEDAETDMTAAWEAFVSKITYPAGHNHMGLDVDAAIQRVQSATSMSIIQEKIFGQVVADYSP